MGIAQNHIVPIKTILIHKIGRYKYYSDQLSYINSNKLNHFVQKCFWILLVFLACILFVNVFIISDNLENGISIAKALYFYIVSTTLFISILIYLLFNNKSYQLNISIIDLSLLLFYFYNISRLLFTENVQLFNNKFVVVTFLLYLYFVWKGVSQSNSSLNFGHPQYYFVLFYLLAGVGQGLVGIIQEYGFKYSINSPFNIVGSFENPAPYAAYLVTIIPFAFGLFLVTDRKNIASNLLKVISFIAFIIGTLVIPLTRTRGAWIAITFGITYILDKKYFITSRIGHYFKRYFQRILILGSSIILVITMVVMLYNLRPGSAFGRLLTWKITLNMIKDAPVWGLGYNKFSADYMIYQSNYFESKNRSDSEKMVAGIIKYSNNEYLEMASEIGVVGLMLFGFIILYIYFKEDNDNNNEINLNIDAIVISAKGTILAIMISSFFAYPLHILPVLLNFIFILSLIPSKNLFELKFSKKKILLITVLVTLFFSSITFLEVRKYNAYKQWKYGIYFSGLQLYNTAIRKYEEIYPLFKDDGEFLLNYGGTLALQGNHNRAINILEQARQYINVPNLYILLGNCYKDIGKFQIAQNYYMRASNMVPNQFYPKYLLANLYFEHGETKEAYNEAIEIINMKIKIKSSAVNDIIKKMQQLKFNIEKNGKL